MTSRDDLLRRVSIANPVPVDTDLPDDLADSRPPVALLLGDGVPTSTQPTYTNTRWWRGPAIAVATALVIVMAISIPLLIGGGQEGTPPADTTPTTIPATTTTPPPPATTMPAPPIPAETWQRVGADVMEPAVGLFDITTFESQLIAMGFDPGDDNRQDGVIFASDDGATWSRLAIDDPALTTGTALMYGITEGGPGLVAGGMSCEDSNFPCLAGPYPTIWTSVDGTAWTRLQIETGDSTGAVTDVLTTSRGIVGAGSIEEHVANTHSRSLPVMWFSSDGVSWTRAWEGEATIDSELASVLGASALTMSPSGMIVGVGSAFDAAGKGVAAVWISHDAVNWDRVDPESPAFKSAHGSDAFMLDVAPSGSDGFIAVGSDGGVAAAVWASSDGRSWTRADTSDQSLESATSLSTITPLDGGFIATSPHGFADLAERPVTLWTSPDGVSWDRVQVLGDGYTQSVVVTETGIAIAGATPSEYNYHASVWTGLVFDPADPPPDPTPATEQPAAPIVSDIGRRGAGLSCERLFVEGYSYAEAAVYWLRYDMPTNLDPDDNGIPCELTYSTDDVAEVFGGSEAMSTILVSDLPELLFEATGPAVDADLICPNGTTEFTNDPLPTREGALRRWEDIYTCIDGSGTFTVGVDVFIEFGDTQYGIWNIASGTGVYEVLQAGGTCITGPTSATTWSDELTGWVEANKEDGS